MKKKNIILGVLAAGTAAAFTGAGAVFHNIIVRKSRSRRISLWPRMR